MSTNSTILLSDALELFLLDCQARRLTASTLTFYKEKVGVFIRWLSDSEVTTLDAITNVHIKRWLVDMQDRGLTDHTQHDYARAAKTFLGYCVRDELIAKSPFANVKMPKVGETLPIVLADTEIRSALQNVAEQRDRLIVRFILDSGVRASELLALNVCDVDMQTGVVTVRRGKGTKFRLTAVGATTRKELRRYLIERESPNDSAPLIANLRSGGRLRMVGLMHLFRRMQQQTGIEHLTAHTLRRTMATRSLAGGMDSHILSRMLGHVDLQMMRRYAAMNAELVQKTSEQHSVVDNLD